MTGIPNEPITYHISPWPILWLNVGALLGIFGFCWLFAQVNQHTIRPGPELAEVESVIFWYLSGIGSLITLAASYLGWISGPEVTLSPEGLSVNTSWLLDKGLPNRTTYTHTWQETGSVTTASFLTMRYLKVLPNRQGSPPFYLPLFLNDRNGFRRNLMALSPKENLIHRWFIENT